MTNNPQYLAEAREDIKKYETADPQEWPLRAYRLKDAAIALENGYNSELVTKNNVSARASARDSALSVWLQLLAILDRDIDPDYDPYRFIALDRSALRPSSDNPQAWAAYRKENEKLRVAWDYQNKQSGLRAVSGRVSQGIKTFIQKYYTTSPQDQRTLRDAIEKNITNQKSRTELLNLLPLLHNTLPGAQARTGEPCPETGTWHSRLTGTDVTASMTRKQYVKKGESMPAYTGNASPFPGVKGYYIGNDFIAEHNVTWTLMSYEKEQNAQDSSWYGSPGYVVALDFPVNGKMNG